MEAQHHILTAIRLSVSAAACVICVVCGLQYALGVDVGPLQKFRDAFSRPLPGLDAQLRMAPRPRANWDPRRFPEGARTGAALLLVYPHGNAWHIPLTVRGSTLPRHTGQVSLPGGRVDVGESIETAALREAAEEVGIVPAGVELVGRLTPVSIPVSGFVLHAVVGIGRGRPRFRPADWEVARVIEAPLTTLRDPAIVRAERRLRTWQGETMEIDVPYFEVDGEKVWGATAMVLAEFLAVVESVGL
jgi:8-oxo-dGTP pyrophosphatase MutT (NUDIX family)